MKKELIEYYCDVCHKKVPYPFSLEKCVIPYKEKHGFGSYSIELVDVEMCESCLQKFYLSIDNHFAQISYGSNGVIVKKR